mmetsp:Transcript_66092/g.187705  ORF Transcript_66092/g.187705 Transcript_66092/m.187705 type:complete len:365 (+) Transcript_66092:214-1308(+)
MSRPEQAVLGDDVRGAVEVAKVREDAVGVTTHPLAHRHQHALPGELGDDPPAAGIVLVTLDEGAGELVEDLAALDAASDDHVVAAPAVVGAHPVEGERAAKVRLRHQDGRVEDGLRLELLDKAAQRLVDLRELLRGLLEETAVMVEAAELDEEEVALGLARTPRGDELRHLVELLGERRVRHVVGVQRDVVQDRAQVLARLDGLCERLRVLLAVDVPVPLAGDVADGVLPEVEPAETDSPAVAVNDLRARVEAERPGRRSGNREGRGLEALAAQVVGDAAAHAPRRGARVLASQRLRRVLLVRVRVHALAEPAALQPRARDGLQERADVADEGCLLLLLVEVLQERHRRVDAELRAVAARLLRP